MSTLPLHYHGIAIGSALVDDWVVETLPPTLHWTLDIPMRLRRAYERPDLLLAALHEDPTTLENSHPILVLPGAGPTIRLSRLVLRPHIAELIRLLSHNPTNHIQYHAELRRLSSSIWRVTHVNRNRADCRASNLREVFGNSGHEPQESH